MILNEVDLKCWLCLYHDNATVWAVQVASSVVPTRMCVTPRRGKSSDLLSKLYNT